MTALATTDAATNDANPAPQRSRARGFGWMAMLLMFLVTGLGYGTYSIVEMIERFRPTQTVAVEVLGPYHFRTGKNSQNHEYGVTVRLPSGHTRRVRSVELYECCANTGEQTADESAYLHRIVGLTINGRHHKVAPKVGFVGLLYSVFAVGLPAFVIFRTGPRELFEQMASGRTSRRVFTKHSAGQFPIRPLG
jgi:hypothetical protein